jgi:hypothetical protein
MYFGSTLSTNAEIFVLKVLTTAEILMKIAAAAAILKMKILSDVYNLNSENGEARIVSKTYDMLGSTPISDKLCGHVSLFTHLKKHSIAYTANTLLSSRCENCRTSNCNKQTLVSSSPPMLIKETSFSRPEPADDNVKSFPEVVYVTYNQDLNLFMIHDAVRAKVSVQLRNISKDKCKNYAERQKLQSGHSSLTKARFVEELKRVNQVEVQIHRIEEYIDWETYIQIATPILLEYSKLGGSEGKGDVKNGGIVAFRGNNITARQQNASEDIVIRRLKLIRAYLDSAKKILDIRSFSTYHENDTCFLCGSAEMNGSAVSINAATASDDYGTVVCDCGRETIGVARCATYRDSARIDTGTKNSYDDLVNFQKRLDAFEGKQRTQPPKLLQSIVETYLNQRKDTLLGGRICSEIREEPYIYGGKKEGTSVSLLEEALLATSNSAFYRDIELIANWVWGWKLADLSENGLRPQLIADYVETQRIYEEIKERESSLNVNLRLFFHLRARDFECELTDFKIVSSLDSLKYHQRMFRMMCKRAHLTFTPILQHGISEKESLGPAISTF